MATLISLLGIDPDDFVWQDLALCANDANPTHFYEDYETDDEVARQVDQMCLSCPVMEACAKQGMQGEHGVWGGIYWNGAGKPDKARNAHKTEEVWNEIRDRLA